MNRKGRKFCQVEGCKRCSDSYGYCRQHKKQIDRNGRITRIEPYPAIACKTDSCPYWAEFDGYCWGCYQNDRRRANSTYRKHALKKKYGITLEEYNRMHCNQDGLCKICGEPETLVDGQYGALRHLAVDHCHQTGRIRGLLCARCNTTIGKVNEEVDLLEKMIRYLLESDNP